MVSIAKAGAVNRSLPGSIGETASEGLPAEARKDLKMDRVRETEVKALRPEAANTRMILRRNIVWITPWSPPQGSRD